MGTLARTTLFAALLAAGSVAWAKLPPPPPMDDKAKAAAEEKKAKAAAAAAANKKALEDAMERAVKNRDANLRKAGKAPPKPMAAAGKK